MALTFLPRPAAEQSKSRDCTHQGDTQLPFQLHFGNVLIPLNTVAARRAAAVVLGVERRQAFTAALQTWLLFGKSGFSACRHNGMQEEAVLQEPGQTPACKILAQLQSAPVAEA